MKKKRSQAIGNIRKAPNSLLSKIIIMVIVAELAGAVGSLVTFPSIGSWYASLAKPELAPPNWVFGPVWITLYALMGVAAGMVWASNHKRKIFALKVYGAQLVLNVLWSLLFFGLHSPGIAFICIIALWLAIIATMAAFKQVSKNAFLLLAPYIAWVTIALFLNYSIWMLN